MDECKPLPPTQSASIAHMGRLTWTPPAPALGLVEATMQGHTLVHFSAQPKPFWSHLPVSPCLIDWGKIMHPIYPTKYAHVEPKDGRV